MFVCPNGLRLAHVHWLWSAPRLRLRHVLRASCNQKALMLCCAVLPLRHAIAISGAASRHASRAGRGGEALGNETRDGQQSERLSLTRSLATELRSSSESRLSLESACAERAPCHSQLRPDFAPDSLFISCCPALRAFTVTARCRVTDDRTV